nr:unnamed protein product [Callosobruchus chinensis]
MTVPQLPDDLNTAVSIFTNCVKAAAEQSIPMSSGSASNKAVPWWNDDIKVAIRDKKSALNRFRRNPTMENMVIFKKLRVKARRKTNDAQKKSWQEYVSSITAEVSLKEVWRKINIISGNKPYRELCALKDENSLIEDIEEVCSTLAKQFEATSDTANYSESFRIVKEVSESDPPDFSTAETCCVHFCRLRSVHADPHLTLNGHYIAVRPTVKLLGIVFDCKLNWKDHIDHLVIRCRKVLNLIKCMARIRWGADREILIRIYQALIESRLSYASIVYGSARRSKIKELERLQLAAVRAATGAFRTSPTVAVLCEASIMPLHLKIGQQTLMYEAKIKHLPHHINSVLFNYTNEFAERPSATRPARSQSEKKTEDEAPSVPYMERLLTIIGSMNKNKLFGKIAFPHNNKMT